MRWSNAHFAIPRRIDPWGCGSTALAGTNAETRGTAIRYTIEYLAGVEAKRLVSSTVFSDESLAAAVLTARVGATHARTRHRANGFQIRDLLQGGRVVASESFWGFAA